MCSGSDGSWINAFQGRLELDDTELIYIFTWIGPQFNKGFLVN